MITELDAGTIGSLPGWDYPLPASQVHEILEQACTPGIYRVSLADRNGRARLRARHGAIGDARRLGEPRDMVEVSAPVVLRGETVAVVRVAGAPDESTALEDAARLTAARLGDAWAAAQEIDSLAGEIVHAYEELHLLYELGEALTGQFTVAQAAELVLDKIRHALHAAWAELRLNDDERPVHVTSRQRAGPFGAHRITAEHRLSATLRSGGQTIGSIVLLRTRDDDPFSSADSKLLDAVAIFAGSAIRNGQLYQELRRQADTDALTGLLNHRALQERLDERLDAARSRDETLGILMLDVDDFKLFNDSYGHLVGDQILRLVGEVVREICGDDGVVGRYGGDEFVLALSGADRAGLGAVAQRLHETMIGRGVPVHGHEMVPVSLSIGCALFPED